MRGREMFVECCYVTLQPLPNDRPKSGRVTSRISDFKRVRAALSRVVPRGTRGGCYRRLHPKSLTATCPASFSAWA